MSPLLDATVGDSARSLLALASLLRRSLERREEMEAAHVAHRLATPGKAPGDVSCCKEQQPSEERQQDAPWLHIAPPPPPLSFRLPVAQAAPAAGVQAALPTVSAGDGPRSESSGASTPQAPPVLDPAADPAELAAMSGAHPGFVMASPAAVQPYAHSSTHGLTPLTGNQLFQQHHYYQQQHQEQRQHHQQQQRRQHQHHNPNGTGRRSTSITLHHLPPGPFPWTGPNSASSVPLMHVAAPLQPMTGVQGCGAPPPAPPALRGPHAVSPRFALVSPGMWPAQAAVPARGPVYTRLTANILTNVMEQELSAADVALRHAMTQLVTQAVRQAVPERAAQVQVVPFGSFASGLGTRSSDLDLVVLGLASPLDGVFYTKSERPVVAGLLDRICRALDATPGISIASLLVIRTARMPLAKVVASVDSEQLPSQHRKQLPAGVTAVDLQRCGMLAVDVSVASPFGPDAARHLAAQARRFPVLRPLALVLRRVLRSMDLGDVASGGLSSYAQAYMILAHLMEEQRAGHPLAMSDLGWLLHGFLGRFGRFNAYTHAVSVAHGGVVHRSAVGNYANMTHFCVVDPLTGYDMTEGAFRSQDVIVAFARAAGFLDGQVQRYAQGCPPDLDLIEALMRPHCGADGDDEFGWGPAQGADVHARSSHQQPHEQQQHLPAPTAPAGHQQAAACGDFDGSGTSSLGEGAEQPARARASGPSLPAQLPVDRPSKLFAAVGAEGGPQRQDSSGCMQELLHPISAPELQVPVRAEPVQHRSHLRSLSNVSLLLTAASDQGPIGGLMPRQMSERIMRSRPATVGAGCDGSGGEDGEELGEGVGAPHRHAGRVASLRAHSLMTSPFVERFTRRSSPRLGAPDSDRCCEDGEGGGAAARSAQRLRGMVEVEEEARAGSVRADEAAPAQDALVLQHPRLQALRQRSLLGRTSSTGGVKRTR